jgi:hypothetical protein
LTIPATRKKKKASARRKERKETPKAIVLFPPFPFFPPFCLFTVTALWLQHTKSNRSKEEAL